MNPIQVGLLGIGTVGSGTFSVLKRNQTEIRRRAGRGIEITMVADLDVARAQSLVGPDIRVVNDARVVIANPDIDIVIELIGGYGIARQLVNLFKLRFDPARQGADNAATVAEQRAALAQSLDGVANLNDDRVLRQMQALILATLRTNFWRRDAQGQPRSYLSFKFDPAKVPGRPSTGDSAREPFRRSSPSRQRPTWPPRRSCAGSGWPPTRRGTSTIRALRRVIPCAGTWSGRPGPSAGPSGRCG
jgi:hypothetical protein